MGKRKAATLVPQILANPDFWPHSGTPNIQAKTVNLDGKSFCRDVCEFIRQRLNINGRAKASSIHEPSSKVLLWRGQTICPAGLQSIP